MVKDLKKDTMSEGTPDQQSADERQQNYAERILEQIEATAELTTRFHLAVDAVIAENYESEPYGETDTSEDRQRHVAAQIEACLKNRAVEMDRLWDHLFTEHFSVEGLPVISQDDLEALCQLYPYLADFLKNTARTANPNHAASLNSQFLGVKPSGSAGAGGLRRLPSDTLSLRSEEYYLRLPAEVSERIVKGNTTMPIYDYLHNRVSSLRELVNRVQEDENLNTKELTEPEVLALLAPLDHLKNYFLFSLNALIILSKGHEYPGVLCGQPANSLMGETKRKKDARRQQSYIESTRSMLASDSAQIAHQIITDQFAEITEAMTAIAEAYYGFLMTKDISYLKDLNLDHIELLTEEIIPAVADCSQAFEDEVDDRTNIKSKDNGRIKRELYKKLLRHERDGDHPGTSLLNVIAKQENTEEDDPSYSAVYGVSYGGIEYPFIYNAVARIKANLEGEEIGENDLPAVRLILLSNYNLAYNPLTAPDLKRHHIGEEPPKGAHVLVLDDNSITGSTTLQISRAMTSHGILPNFGFSDINLDPEAVVEHPALQADIANSSKGSSRPIPKRKNPSKKIPKRGRMRGKPDFLNASRYF